MQYDFEVKYKINKREPNPETCYISQAEPYYRVAQGRVWFPVYSIKLGEHEGSIEIRSFLYFHKDVDNPEREEVAELYRQEPDYKRATKELLEYLYSKGYETPSD